MEREIEFQERFINYLVSIGYPRESINIEYPIKKYNVDIAIVDPETNIIVQIFELKKTASKAVIEAAKDQLKNYLDALGFNIPAYIVLPESTSNSFNIIDYNTTERVSTESFDYISQLNTRKSTIKSQIQTSTKKKVDHFIILCWLEAFIILVLFILQKIFNIDISWIDLTILGIIVVLSLLPFFTTVSFNGIEFKRKDNSD